MNSLSAQSGRDRKGKRRKRALSLAFQNILHAATMNEIREDFRNSPYQEPRGDPAAKRFVRVLSKHDLFTESMKAWWFQDNFRLARSFDRWFFETGTGRPLWTQHGNLHRTRQAFVLWTAWAHCNAARTDFSLSAHRRIYARVWRVWWESLEATTIRNVVRKRRAARFFKEYYAKWLEFRLQVRAQRAARDLLREEAQEPPKKSPSKRKKKKGKRAADIITIEAEVEPIVQNLADMKTIEHDIPSSAYVDVADVADSSVATALTCVVCFHGASEYAIVPCGHRCLCETCSTKFKSDDAKCPVCRGAVMMSMRIFG
jgi:hypothetical protein